VNASFLILILIAFALMWLLLIRPQRRRQNEQLAMQENLRRGDEVVTAGGLYGTVERLDEDEVAIEIADGVVVRVARRAIAGVMPKEEDEEGLEEEATEELVAEEEIEAGRAKPM
jgi:preprotein translocase subunit YajC